MKTYVITGATSGIGKALAEEFSKSGIVFAGGRSSEKLEEISKISENIITFYIDMTKPETIVSAAEFIKSKTAKIDTLINGAGCVVAGPVENLDLNELRRQFQVNTFSHIEFTQNLLPLLDGAKIINISSMASFGIFPFISPYCASKRALDIIFNALAVETRKNIQIISVKPGVIATPLWEKSVKENANCINSSTAYEKEMNFLAENAIKNQTRGLNVKKVVDLIVKIDAAKCLKPSYTIGYDAKLGEIFSKLPQGIVNKLIRAGLRYRVKQSQAS